MKIGIIVDGSAESQALRSLIRMISQQVLHLSLINPLYADMQPKATPQQIARSAKSRVEILKSRDVDKIIVLIDREDVSSCPGTLAKTLEAAFLEQGHTVNVVVKNRSFENWLVADVEALEQLPRRFSITSGFVNTVTPNRADNCNADSLLKSISVNRSYHKRDDAIAIMEKQNYMRMAENSRSFRKFLRVLGCPEYYVQSRLPYSPI